MIRALADATPADGNKAHALARLIAAGQAVPDGFVIGAAAFAEVAQLAEIAPDAIGHALGAAGERIAHAERPAWLAEAEARAQELGGPAATAARAPGAGGPVDAASFGSGPGRLAVRSSAALEDGAGGAAAGVFASVTDVPVSALWDAIRAVWTSALTPLAIAYARRHDAALAVSVIVQRFVAGRRVTVYTRPPGAPRGDEAWIQRGAALARVPRARAGELRSAFADAATRGDAPSVAAALATARSDHPMIAAARSDQPMVAAPRAARSDHPMVAAAHADTRGDDPVVAAALAAERAIGAEGGADVELVEGDGVWVVQARPIVHPARTQRRAPPPILLSALIRDGRRWSWDITHNPDPLSPAQAGLVEAVERAGETPYALAVCAGYLYSAPRFAPAVAPPRDAAELHARITAIEARLVALTEVAASVDEAVARYVAFNAVWAGELSPLVAAARRVLLDRLAADGVPVHEVPARAAQLIGPRRVRRDPVMAPAWDVAVPTFAERGYRTTDASAADPASDARDRDDLPAAHNAAEPADLALARAADRPADLAHAADEPPDVALARAAADAAELDDVWFARAQWLVRRALLARSAELALHGEDIFWLPLEVAAAPIAPDDAHRRASAARAAHARAAAWDMPRVVHGAAPEAPAEAPQDQVLRGLGFGPRVAGRVVRLASLHDAPPVAAGDVVVTRAITPALAMLVQGCAALVSETGGLLDHGAALARELSIPCVVSCSGAWSRLADHDRVTVDGDAGLVQIE